MLDIGISLLKIIDKVNKEPRSLIFDILKLINERGEFDLGTLSTQWFMEKVDSLAGKKYLLLEIICYWEIKLLKILLNLI